MTTYLIVTFSFFKDYDAAVANEDDSSSIRNRPRAFSAAVLTGLVNGFLSRIQPQLIGGLILREATSR